MSSPEGSLFEPFDRSLDAPTDDDFHGHLQGLQEAIDFIASSNPEIHSPAWFALQSLKIHREHLTGERDEDPFVGAEYGQGLTLPNLEFDIPEEQ